jgi:hypothetical protein
MTRAELDAIFISALGRSATDADAKYWGGKTGLAAKDKKAVNASIRGSEEAMRRANPGNYELANRNDYHDAKSLKMYDLSISIKGKAPTKGELNNWIRHGSLESYEAMLRDEIKWKSKRKADGSTVTIKYYSKEALDRLGGNIGKGTNAGEIIATPTSYGAVKGDRWSHGYEKDEKDGWTYRSAEGSYKKGLIGRAFGESVEKTLAGTLPYFQFGGGPPVLDSSLSVVFMGEAASDVRFETLKKITGSEKNARRFQKREAVIEDIAAPIIDLLAFRGAPVLSTARTQLKAQSASTLGQDVNVGDVAKDIAISWATYGATRGLDKYATAAKWGSTWTDYGRPLSQVAIGTAAGVARGQEFKDAFASSAVNVAAQQIIPKGANPWVAQAIKVGAPAAYQYSQAKGNDSAQMSAVASAIINYGAGVWQASGQQKTRELVTSPSANADWTASDITAGGTGRKLAVSPQARGMSHDVSGYFLAGGSAKARQDRIALSAQGRY